MTSLVTYRVVDDLMLVPSVVIHSRIPITAAGRNGCPDPDAALVDVDRARSAPS